MGYLKTHYSICSHFIYPIFPLSGFPDCIPVAALSLTFPGSLLLVSGRVFAASEDEESDSFLLTDELSLYTTPHTQVQCMEREVGPVEQSVSSLRKSAEPYTALWQEYYKRMQPGVNASLQNAKDTKEFLMNPPLQFYPSVAAVGFSAILGLYLAKGGRVKRFLFPVGLMTLSASMFYPQHAASLAKARSERADIQFGFTDTCVFGRCVEENITWQRLRNRLRQIVGASTNWKDHQQALAERISLSKHLANSQEELPAKTMKDSEIEVHLPLGTQPTLREKYLNFHNSVRFGRILEDLDSLAVLICYSHTWNKELEKSPLSIVTALVDKIDMRRNIIYPDCDIKFTGHVTWVGKTSIEAKMHMTQFHDGAYTPVLDATFVMVARDPENKRTVSFRSRILPPNSVWMEDAKLKGLEICHPQERNIFNRIFGGFLMRKAYELGWANACVFAGCRPALVAVDDIMFRKPVEIGSLLLLSSQVCYTEGHHVQVRVHTEVLDPLTRQHDTTNVFHFTFQVEKPVPAVVPQSYGGVRLKSSTVQYVSRPDLPKLAYRKVKGKSPGVMFLTGYGSNMNGPKAEALEEFCRSLGNDRKLKKKDVLFMLDEVAEGPQVLVGSSMGGWLMLLAAIARPEKIKALVGISTAADHFVTAFNSLPLQTRKEFEEQGVWTIPTKNNEEGMYTVSMDLLKEAENHCLLQSPIPITCPVRLIHGMKDEQVPWHISMQVAERVLSNDVDIILRRHGQHRMVGKDDIKLMVYTVDDLIDKLTTVA
ncbi:Acyl-coenzyme A thioesterase 9, mitochondrial [Bagarius yarrelli]|uniref:MICOS complex subunit n=1 Tax=Bagarius yarrelli TaxID=175774 RepID=A0A556TWM3_BAGYA|nr:Acyl-coenzyme A thioesterase 9, mitochondrial [Bagarius yarrelli]